MDQNHPQNDQPEHLQSVDDLSQWLGIPVKTIYKWTSNHHSGIPFYRLGKHLRFRFTEIEAWLRKYRSSEGAREFASPMKPGK